MRKTPQMYGTLVAGITLMFIMLSFEGKIEHPEIKEEPCTEDFFECQDVSRFISTKVEATCYHPVPAQTDDSPFTTADMSKINPRHPDMHRWIAVSRDLEQEGFHMGDTVIVNGTWVYDGIWVIHDRMNQRFTHRIDFLVKKGMYLDKFTDVSLIKI